MQRLAVYPGSFDPPTLGHLDIIERATHLFSEVVVAVGVHAGKSPLLTTAQRIEALRLCTAKFPTVRVEAFDGLLVDFVKQLGARSNVRGLRATADFEYEFQMAMVNRRMDETIETIFLMTKWEYSYLSSSIVREVAVLGGDYSEMVPPEVHHYLKAVLSPPRETL